MIRWWLIPVVMAVWLGTGFALGLLIGPVLRRCSEQRERHDSLDEDIQPCQEASCP